MRSKLQSPARNDASSAPSGMTSGSPFTSAALVAGAKSGHGVRARPDSPHLRGSLSAFRTLRVGLVGRILRIGAVTCVVLFGRQHQRPRLLRPAPHHSRSSAPFAPHSAPFRQPAPLLPRPSLPHRHGRTLRPSSPRPAAFLRVFGRASGLVGRLPCRFRRPASHVALLFLSALLRFLRSLVRRFRGLLRPLPQTSAPRTPRRPRRIPGAACSCARPSRPRRRLLANTGAGMISDAATTAQPMDFHNALIAHLLRH